MSVIQDYIKHIIKKHEILPSNCPIHIYINRVNNRLVFKEEKKKKKDGYKLQLQIPETMKLIGSTKRIKSHNKELRKCTESLGG